jgi:aminoglycoside phosphotransferase (APT) family kinase protein
MKNQFEQAIAKAVKATSIKKKEVIQELWSGYGQIIRYRTSNTEIPSVIAKHICYPNKKNHPRGWNTDRSHKRKLKSYKVETEWYQKWASHCSDECRVPKCFAIDANKSEMLIVLEDLDFAGFPVRQRSVSYQDMQNCIDWLANFHAIFMNKSPEGLWKNGTYWHLDTRPDELSQLSDERLKAAAGKIDKVLKQCHFKTIVHGDAKLANFCFSSDCTQIAAVDFQYVGGGCGMKDLAYFVGSCFHEEECEKFEKEILDYYFASLAKAIKRFQSNIDFQALETEWRKMYYYAWADFHRFLKGWSPEHWKINTYSEKVTRLVIAELGIKTSE